ncbi:MAG: beta-propeller domain-containing protein [Bacilli bacterium]|nr:beta-propeller domain-containing protein [Bacilli bacterium]MDD4077623.1 beta-propeller domain-containing protein [Bacilli bacterium]MDD4388571.1 beta-propeller domain-containing protein [Bacilli bacterium]
MKINKFLSLVFLLLIFLLFGCTGPKQVNGRGLNSVNNQEELKSLLAKSKSNPYYSLFGEFALDSARGQSPTNNAEIKSSNEYTKTNVQVEGVDEGDKIKTDGNRIYSIGYNELRVVEILDDGRMELMLHEKLINEDQVNDENQIRIFYNYTYYDCLYITDQYLVVLGQLFSYQNIGIDNEGIDMMLPYRSTNSSIVFIYDLETLALVDKYEVSGLLNTSRLIDNNLYLISNYTPYSDHDELRPWTKKQNQIEFIDYQDIKYLPNMEYQAYTIITTIKLNNQIEYEKDTFLASSIWEQVYVSKNAIYLAANQYAYNIFGVAKDNGKIISYQFVDGKVVYGGAGSYRGRIYNQFAIDEYDSYLRIATTEGWRGNEVRNRLYVFERKLINDTYTLKTVGLIDEGLGKPGEIIRSVRFSKDKATIVTFEQTDPFYTVDLTDPANPKIVGTLEIPGFSTYQHPWTDNLIIGIGFDAVDGITTGMKLSLYDISDFNNPIEVGKPLILSNNSSWSYSEALFNHKAIYIDKEYNMFGFSLYRSNWSNGYYSSTNDYLVFDVDESQESPIQIKHTFSHINYFTDDSDYRQNYWNYNFNIERAVRINNNLYLISGEVITAHNINDDFNLIDEIIFLQAN